MTGATADNRVLFFDWRAFKYGTDDKGHAAALILSLALLAIIALLFLIGSVAAAIRGDIPWIDRVFGVLGSAFTFVAGIAVGKSGGNSKPPPVD